MSTVDDDVAALRQALAAAYEQIGQLTASRDFFRTSAWQLASDLAAIVVPYMEGRPDEMQRALLAFIARTMRQAPPPATPSAAPAAARRTH